MIRKLDPRHWRLVRRAFDRIRKRFFSKEPRQPQLIVDADLERLRDVLGTRYFTNSWELSYHYEGEDCNMRRPIMEPNRSNAWQQDHVRAFKRDDGIYLHCHREPEPTEHPHAHLHTAPRFDPAVRSVEAELEVAGLDVQKV